MNMKPNDAPEIIELAEDTDINPETQPQFTDESDRAAAKAPLAEPKKRSFLLLGFTLFLTTVGFFISVSLWGFVATLLAQNPVLGWVALALCIALALWFCVFALREVFALTRLRRLDKLQRQAQQARKADDFGAAQQVIKGLHDLYGKRPDTAWGRERLRDAQSDIFDADGMLQVASTVLLAPLDTRATKKVESAARRVATVTALMPLAWVDVFMALGTNLRMIRMIAEVYGGRGGVISSWRLARMVMAHLVATGALALGDDLIGSIAGSSALSKISRRFGEGFVNGALTVRIGLTAIEICRPIPFTPAQKPSVSGVVKDAVLGSIPFQK